MKRINDIINEEFNGFLNEIVVGNVPAYNFEQVNDEKYRIFVEEPKRDPPLSAKFEVSIRQTSHTEKVYTLSFREEGGDYASKTGWGVQFRILATITKITKEFAEKYDVNIITYQPVATDNKYNEKTGNKKNVDTNQRGKLYMEFVKGASGDEFDGFSFKKGRHVNLEKTHPSYPIKNGVQDADDIQEVITQLSDYEGYYEIADIAHNDPNYVQFRIYATSMYMQTGDGERKNTSSARRFYDWMLDYPELEYIQGDNEPNRVDVDRTPPPEHHRNRQATIQPVTGSSPTPIAHAEIGSFQYFLQNEIWSNPDYAILSPYFETAKTVESFDELKQKAHYGLRTAHTNNDTGRFLDIINAIDNLKRQHERYLEVHGTNMNEILNEVEKDLLNLL